MAALLCAGIAGQVALAHVRIEETPHIGESVIAALGGARALASEVVWYRVNRLEQDGRFGELMQLADLLTKLEPHDAEVWTYSGWNLAYNISSRMPRIEDRWRWVYAGMRLMRDSGLSWNPGDPDICRELAFMFEMKIGLDNMDVAAPLYREEWRKIVADAAARDAWAEIGMDRARMDEISRREGMTDWSNPQAVAYYFADLGMDRANSSQKPFLNEIRRQTRKLYFEGFKKGAE